MRRKYFICLMIFVMLNIPLVASGIEETVAKIKEPEIEEEVEEEAEEAEEDTMLNIMPRLKIPKRTSINYSIGQQFEYLDNFLLETGDRKGRFASITSPTVSIRYPIGRSYLEGDYAYGFTYYMDENEEVHRHSATVKLYHRPTRRLSIGISEVFSRDDLPDQQKDIDVKVAGKSFSRNTLNAQAKYEISDRWRCGLNGSYRFLYFNERPSGASPDNTAFSSGADVEYIISRRTNVGLAYSFSNTFYKEAGDRKDSSGHSVRLRYSHMLQKALTVAVSAGYNFIDYEDEDKIGVSAGTSLDYNISRFTKFGLGYNYGFTDSSKEDYLVYRGHTFSASFSHKITPRLAMGTSTSYDLWLYDSKHDLSTSRTKRDRNSEVARFECRLNYKLTKKIDIGATYNTSAKFSDFTNDEYFSNHYLITVRANF